MNAPFIALRAVNKIYGQKIILKNISLSLYAGDFITLEGVNGAGKSSLLNVMAGLVKPDSGDVTLAENLRLAYMGHSTFVYPGMTALENLRFWASVNRLKYSRSGLLERLKRVGLKKFAEEKAGVFSRGMAQRLNFARFLLNEPALMLMDEPFTGLDAEARELMSAEIEKRVRAGASVFMISHAPAIDAPLASARFALRNRVLERADDEAA